MRKLAKLAIAAGVVASLSFSVVGVVSPFAASGASPVAAQQAGPTITITDFTNEPADLTAGVGQAITVTNNDGFPHTVTANDGTFNVDVPPKGSVTLTVSKAGTFPYSCTYHPGQHNPTSITVS